MKSMLSKLLFVCVALLVAALTCGLSGPAGRAQVLIIQDERPQMDVLAKSLEEKGKLSVTIADQQSLPRRLSSYKAVIVFIHKDLYEPTERAIIDYTKAGGRLVCLHHSISSKKAENKFYFDFLGVQLNKGPIEDGGYAWKPSSWTLVNLNSKHYITNHNIEWDDEARYTSSDQPGVEKSYPCTRLKDDSEVFTNHRFTDGRDKTVLCGLIYTDKATGRTYMQDRGGWIKTQGKGSIVYLMPGHCISDCQNENVAQMVLNALTWKQRP
ncbi:MAG: ThuA domain-containing protein [Phycisphaerales bacterium]|nr:MAG: ThuA domain-containing protein [Phycisphaerales bacterium]